MTTTRSPILPLGPVRTHGTLCEVHEFADLPLIWNPDCNAVLLREPGDTQLDAGSLDRLERRWRTGLRLEVAPDHAGLATLLDATHGAGEDNGIAIASTLHRLTTAFCELTGADAAGLRLARLTARMCPRFHYDRVLVRMLLTLRGTTTEVATDAGLAERLESFNADPTADPAHAPRPTHVMRPEPGDLLLLRGSLWEDSTVGAAVHRSPAASPTSPRLICSWDPLG